MTLQIHVVLPANRHLPRDTIGRLGKAFAHIAALKRQWRCHIRIARCNCVYRPKNMWQHINIHFRPLRRPPRNIAALGDHGKQGLTIKFDSHFRENWLISRMNGRDIIHPRDIRSRQHPNHTLHSQDSAQIKRFDGPMRDL